MVVTTIVNLQMVKGVRPRYDIYIGRELNYPKATFPLSKWHNPYPYKKYGDRCIDLYEEDIRGRPDLLEDLDELVGKTLGCWCRGRYGVCHGQVLLKLLNEKYPDSVFVNEWELQVIP
jgi:hypothetical protein